MSLELTISSLNDRLFVGDLQSHVALWQISASQGVGKSNQGQGFRHLPLF